MMDWLRTDVRLALRLLARRPGFSALAILTLGLGLAINTLAFSAVNALVFKPFRFDNADTTGWLFVATTRDPLADASLPVFEALERRATRLDGLAAEGRAALAYDAGGRTEQVWALLVSRQYFSLIRPTLLLGRALDVEDGAAADVSVVVSERFWRRRLGEAPNPSSLSIVINQQQARIVGVMRDGFQGPGGVFEPDMWVPLASRRALGLPSHLEAADGNWLTVLARPVPGTTADAIAQEAVAIATDAGLDTAGANAEPRVQYVPFVDRHPEARQIGKAAFGGLAAVGLVLLVACFNVAGLVLARSVERRRDVGLRAALGASRWRLARAQLTEGLVLATAGAAAALVVGAWSASLLSVFSLPAPIPQRLHFVLDWRVLAFIGAMAVLAAVVPALAPVAQVVRSDPGRWLGGAGTAQAGGLAQRRARRLFVALQVAGSTCFLALAFMFGRHFVREWLVDPGFDAAHMAVMELSPTSHGYTPLRARELGERIEELVRATPGVTAAATTDRVSFFVGAARGARVIPEGRTCAPDDCPSAGLYAASPDLFEAMGIPLVAGRTFGTGAAGRDTAIVNATAASAWWPDQNPIGRTLRIDGNAQPLTVVGVAGDIVHRSTTEPRQPYVYRPIADDDFAGMFTIVARAGDADEAQAALIRALHSADPRLPPQMLQTMTERMAMPMWMPRTVAAFFGACGAAAALLSTIGLFGVTYFAVSQRRREFGVRFALGATRGDVRRLVMTEAFRLAGPGMLIGGAGGVLLGLVVRSLVRGLDTGSITTYVVALALQSLATVAASWVPAAQAARSNPLEVLRAD